MSCTSGLWTTSCFRIMGRMTWGAECCDEPICICLSVREHISETARPIVCACSCGGCSVFPWRRCGARTFGFVDDVIFADNGQYGTTYSSLSLQRVTSLRRRARDIAPLLRRSGRVVS